jgi:hypothetical protein
MVMLTLCGSCSRRAAIDYAPSAQQIYADALANAKIVNKPLFVLFTRDEFWCQRLEGYHAEEPVARLLEKYFLQISIRLDATPGGEEMYHQRGGDRGVPAYTIVDPRGELLADSGDTGRNVGFPNTADELQRYLAMMKTACPAITDDELGLLRAKLEARRLSDVTTN